LILLRPLALNVQRRRFKFEHVNLPVIGCAYKLGPVTRGMEPPGASVAMLRKCARRYSSRSERTSAVGEGRNLLNDSVQVRQQRNGQPIASRHPMITTDDDPEFARVTDTQLRRSNGTHLCR
jgi:hypothetical protein